jgi:hypothetical protein
MASNINATDPYANPFEWSNAYPHEAPEDRLFGLLPCPWQCEQGLLPLVGGDYIACPSCGSDPEHLS